MIKTEEGKWLKSSFGLSIKETRKKRSKTRKNILNDVIHEQPLDHEK